MDRARSFTNYYMLALSIYNRDGEGRKPRTTNRRDVGDEGESIFSLAWGEKNGVRLGLAVKINFSSRLNLMFK